jgi:serine/threonine protein kinase
MLGRYALHQAIAVGETASVHLALLEGAEGFRKTVAIKRLVPGKVHEQAAHAELTYEGCLGALIHHPNVVSVIDLGELENGPFLVMEYVLGETAAGLGGPSGRLPVPIAVAIVVDVLRGLEAVHVARDAGGGELDIVHRNVRPENILVGIDGMARVIDFGSAVSALDSMTIPNRQRSLRQEEMTSPEQRMGLPVDGRADVFAAAVVLWELVAGTRPFRNLGAHRAFLVRPTRSVPPASAFNMDVSPALEAVMERALSWSLNRRFESAARFAEELEAAVAPSSRAEVGAFVEGAAAAKIAAQRKVLDAIGAPYGRISTPPTTSRHLEAGTSSSLVRAPSSSNPAPAGSRPPSAPSPRLSKTQNARLAKQFVELQKNLRRALGHARTVATSQPGLARSVRRLATRAKRVNPANVMAGLSLACLLLAGTRASLGARSFSDATPASRVAPDAECAPREAAPVRQDSEEGAANMGSNGTVPAVASAPPMPSAGEPSSVVAPPLEPSDVRGPGGRPLEVPPLRVFPGGSGGERGVAPTRVRHASSCNPPFTIDDSGIRRIKPDCLR